MRLTEFGKLVRMLRLEFDLSLKQMADAMLMSSAHLSALEYGDKKLNESHIDMALTFLASRGVSAKQLADVREAGAKSMETVNVKDLDGDARALVFAFARRLQAGEPPNEEITNWAKDRR